MDGTPLKDEPPKPMQKMGEVCENCRETHEKWEKEPQILRRLGGTTMNNKMIVPYCAYCDGDEIGDNDPGKEPVFA